HWCHVMERESFLDKEIAAFLNKHFVCIKVDREERPDVDKIYMTSVYAINGRGGWPMSVFMLPDSRPFYGGTYFPARDGDRQGMPGFLTMIKKINELWTKDTAKVEQSAGQLTEYIKQELNGRQMPLETNLAGDFQQQAQQSLAQQFDDQFGGFGYSPTNPDRPKFPEPANLVFLVYRVRAEKAAGKDAQEALKMLRFTLDRMGMGGIRDHLGGGFHRYSVDRFWRIPHFEKMLYDNGQLASVYAEAFQLTADENYHRILREMLDFVLREMTDPEGGFYSALDAESEDIEGKFYRWEKEEVEKLLSKEEFKIFAVVYGLDRSPNFEEEYYAPQLSRSMLELAGEQGIKPAELEAKLLPIRRKLLAHRDKRPRPLTDTKILTGWNGLMIRGFADAGRILKEPRYIQAAERAANFVLEKLTHKKGRLLRTYGNKEAKFNAYLVDYAFLVDGLLGLHEATGAERWLQQADRLMQLQLKLFWDDQRGGFFFTSEDHESLLARSKNPLDGARPSGNSVSAQNLIYLGKVLKNEEYLDHAEKTVRSISGMLAAAPAAATRMTVAVGQLRALGRLKVVSPPPPEKIPPEEKKNP
ncbi:MAG: thioredoxin domain-containing protein, partial [Pirellulaceae bacterium]